MMESSSEAIDDSCRIPIETQPSQNFSEPSNQLGSSGGALETPRNDDSTTASTNNSNKETGTNIVSPTQTDRHHQKRRRKNQPPFIVVSMKDPNNRRTNHDRQNYCSSNRTFFPWNKKDHDSTNFKSERSFWGENNHDDDDDDDDGEDDDYDDWYYHQQHHMAYVTPDFNHWCHLTMALLLCTSMAILSAYDAEMHCLQHEIYAVLQLVNDDDEAIQEAYEAAYNTAIDNETMKCIHMFQRVVLPIGGSTAVCAVIALTIIYVYSWMNKRRHRDSINRNLTTGTSIPIHDRHTAEKLTIPAQHCDSDSQSSSMSGPISQSAKALLRPYVHQWSTIVSITVSLFILYLIMFALQTYSVIAVMLTPRTDDSNSSNGNDADAANNNNNPYQSLAAVDRYGQVGDNANLYYLSWLSFGLSIALIYQVSTSCFRVMRAAKRHGSQPADGIFIRSNDKNSAPPQYNPTAYVNDTRGKGEKNDKLLPVASWDHCETPNCYHSKARSSSHKKRRKLLVDQSRAAWYSSMYRLRVRTGIWTATCITCWIIVASSQYIWRQTLWPSFLQQRKYYHNKYKNNNYYANENENEHESSVGDKNSPFSYFSVCHQSSYYSSSMFDNNNYNNFTPQLCRRTLAAWFVGFVAAILCAAAIVMHVAARYFNKNQGSSYRLPAKVVQAAVAQQQHHQLHPKTNDVALQTPTAADSDGKSIPPSLDYYDHDVIQLLTTQTTEAWKNASPSALLSRYYSHHHPNRLPLRTEIVLGILLSILLGVNAVMVTGVEGPALKVGNLYYASWISFLLCVRICLGCIEEYFNVDEEDDDDERQDSSQVSENSATNNVSGPGQSSNERLAAYEAPQLDGIVNVSNTPINVKTLYSPTGNESVNSKDLASVSVDSTSSAAEKQEKKRIGRVRNYFFLSIFATVCGASSYDAAANQEMALTREQMYMMYAPCVVAIISYLLFGLSLSKRCYSMISKFWVGGLLSIVSFSILLADLLLTMHSEDSWAVNNIGEISMANLYYFAWASIFTAGVQMSSYVKALFGIRKLDHMSALWVGICKVCFIILGASLHIWHTISDNCEFDEITLGAVTFCSRTVLAITVSLTGMLVGGLVVLGRILILIFANCRCARFQSHVEMLISLFLVFLFVAAVALITGIGGPGQSVGDLYYSTWGAFWVSIGIFVSCYHQLNEEEKESDSRFVKSDSTLV